MPNRRGPYVIMTRSRIFFDPGVVTGMADYLGNMSQSCGRINRRSNFYLKRPPKAPDRAYPLVKNQEYAYVYDGEHRPG